MVNDNHLAPHSAVGAPAPEFALACVEPTLADGRRSLAGYRGHWLALVFYPRDFSLVCPTELTAVSTYFDEFQLRECAVLGISIDSVDSHRRWLSTPRNQGGLEGLRFPLASDPDGSV